MKIDKKRVPVFSEEKKLMIESVLEEVEKRRSKHFQHK